MKKIVSVLATFLFLFGLVLFAQAQVLPAKVITLADLAIRTSSDHKTAGTVGAIPKGTVVPVLAGFGDYADVSVYDIKQEKTFTGVMWTGCFDDTLTVIGQGATLRDSTKKEYKAIAYIWPGSKVKVLKLYTTWIKVEYLSLAGWIYFPMTAATK